MGTFNRNEEEQFLNKPAIIELAQVCTDKARETFSDAHYALQDFDLR